MEEEYLLRDHPRYETIQLLGRGHFGFVVHAKDRESNDDVAIKFLPRGTGIDINVEREVLGHSNLFHPHVIQFNEVFLTKHYLAIAMEYAAGGNLHHYIFEKKVVSEDMARWFFQQLIIGLDYIHKMGMANRDIKLENTLLSDDPWPLVKICDFGLCKREDFDSTPHSYVGTRPYMAPEIMNSGVSKTGTYDGKKADIWSCGVLLYVMLVHHYPFERPGEKTNENTIVVFQRIMREEYDIPRGRMSDECADLIRKILVVDPNKRLDISQIQQHKWYQKNLPKHALSMNKEIDAQNPQSEDIIKGFLEEARHV